MAMMKDSTKLSTNPFFIISLICRVPVPKAMALGAVATGNMNAQLDEMAAGIMSSVGGTFVAMATEANNGISKVVVAVLLVISVRKVTMRQTLNSIA